MVSVKELKTFKIWVPGTSREKQSRHFLRYIISLLLHKASVYPEDKVVAAQL